MKPVIILFFALLAFQAGINSAFTQTAEDRINIRIEETALLRVVSVTPEPALSQLASASSNGKSPGLPIFSNENRLQYTVIRKSPGARKKIVAFLNQAPPPGIILLARTYDNFNTGAGERGSCTGEIVLKTVSTDVIRDIGTCHTGAAPDSGPLVKVRAVRKNGKAAGTVLDFPPIQVMYAMVDQ